MDSRGNEGDDSENIELETIEETDTKSRSSSIAIEETDEETLKAKEKTDSRCIRVKTITWKIFKSIVFIICVILLVIQSVEFYYIYSEYPTNMVQKFVFMNEVKLPAVTLCFKYTVSTTQFCYDNPNWCERPENLEEFCEKHRFHCEEDASNLTIPIFHYYGYYELFLGERANYLFNDTSINPHLYWSMSGNVLETRTFIKSGDFIYTCYSRNLHLYQSGSKPETMEVELNEVTRYIDFELDLHPIELYDPSGNPQVFLGIHSPFVPSNPILHGEAIRSGYTYRIEVQLKDLARMYSLYMIALAEVTTGRYCLKKIEVRHTRVTTERTDHLIHLMVVTHRSASAIEIRSSAGTRVTQRIVPIQTPYIVLATNSKSAPSATSVVSNDLTVEIWHDSV
ncbi:hypothetical protein AVEN_229475-1 [Araneus ventricosus]|uniref:Uncharacterized protein n=1 Tax=Araneus ventricosus TaxID=182803 RepID=A0A4Y2IZW8_ARAVE|nr:hypothetical protein AVEN_229475-1 [Araneus ventricosus]